MSKIKFDRKAGHFNGDVGSGVYNQSYAGNALQCLFVRGTPLPSDVNPKNMIGRGADFSFRESYQLMPVIEWNTYFVQELILGMQEMGNFEVKAIFTLAYNDQMPTVKTLAWELDNTIIEAVGDDHPNHGMVLNAFYGQRWGSRSHGWSPQGLVNENISGLYRYRLPGKEWKLRNSSAIYPGEVVEVNLEDSVSGIPTQTN